MPPYRAPDFDIFLIKTLQDANFGLNMNERFEGGKGRKEKRRRGRKVEREGGRVGGRDEGRRPTRYSIWCSLVRLC